MLFSFHLEWLKKIVFYLIIITEIKCANLRIVFSDISFSIFKPDQRKCLSNFNTQFLIEVIPAVDNSFEGYPASIIDRRENNI